MEASRRDLKDRENKGCYLVEVSDEMRGDINQILLQQCPPAARAAAAESFLIGQPPCAYANMQRYV